MFGVFRRNKFVQKTRARIMFALARLLVHRRPLQAIPGWRFADIGRADDWGTQTRQRIWEFFHWRQPRPDMVFPWLDGLRIETQLGNDLSRSLFVAGCFEPNEFFWLSTVLQPGMIFIDVGANEGLYSLFAACRVQPAGRVLAVEPSAREVYRLRRNLSLNPDLPVTVCQVALGARVGEAELKIAEDLHAGHNTLGEFVYGNVQCVRAERISLTTLDALVAREGLSRVDAVKIDVEGGELGVLQGGIKTLETFKPVILFELLEPALQAQGASAQAVLSLLSQLNYEIRGLDPDTGKFTKPVSAGRTSDNLVAVPRDIK